MFTKANFHVGQKVYFGRPNGEQTLGVILKLNPAKAKIKTLESRGTIRQTGAGVVWTVPYTLITPADGTQADSNGTPAPAPAPVKRRAVGIVSRTVNLNRPSVRVGATGEWIIANENPTRWASGQAVLISYDPADQIATIIDPDTLQPA